MFCGCRLVAKAPRCQRGYRGFESLRPLQVLREDCMKFASPRYKHSRRIRVTCKNECGNFTKQRHTKYCSNKCQLDHQNASVLRAWQSGLISGAEPKCQDRLRRPIRDYMLKKAGYRCEQCGWDKVNPSSGRSPLCVDHRDGNPTNHAESNLKVLCPNCHSLTPTFGGLNKGNGRSSRRKYYAEHGFC